MISGRSDLTLPSGKDEKKTRISERCGPKLDHVPSPLGDARMIIEATQYSLRYHDFIKMIKYEKNTQNI